MSTPLLHQRVTKPTMLLRSLGILICIAVLFSACTPVAPTFTAPTAASSPTPVAIDLNQLYANPWTLVAYGDPANPTVVQGVTSLTAQFAADGTLTGFGGCNNYSGTYQAGTDGTMQIGALATTQMACAEGMDQETAYLNALQTASSFSFTGQGQLQIKYVAGKEQVMVFAIGQKPLTATGWVLISMGDPTNPQRIPAGTVITAEFLDDGSLSGSSGCNQYNASYTLQDAQMTLGPVSSTQMACATGMDTEQSYLQALGTVQQYSILNQVLTLTYNQGAGVLIYTSADLSLEHTQWTLSLLNGQPVVAEQSITAVFTPADTADTGNISGSSGCNSYNAAYTLSGTNLTVQPPISTMMACATGMDTEQAYLQMLQESTSYQISANILVLTGPSGALTFNANRTPLSEALWKLVSMGDVNNPQPPVTGSNFAAQFSVVPGSLSGMLTGTTGCNEYSAAYTASTSQIKINPPFSTGNRSCVPGLAEQEQNYFLALNDATTYSISGNNLVLPYDGGKQSLIFEGTQLESATRPPLKDLNGSTWYLWYINNTPLIAGTTIYGQFVINADGASGTLSGSAGCNNYLASFGQNMGVQTSLSAKQVCTKPAGIMNQEGIYINILSRAFGYWQTGSQLIVNSGLGVLTYQNTLPPQSSDQTHLLAGPTWYLVSYNSSYSEAGSQEPFTLFNTNGTLNGFTGCNSFQGTYTTSPQHITISNLNSTKAACPSSSLQAQEQAMLGVLSTAKDYQVNNTVMQIVGSSGALNYSLTPLHRTEQIQPPVASFTGPSDAPTGQVVTFDGNSSSGQVPIVFWEWSFGDGNTATGPIVSHVYATPGSYRVKLTVTDQRSNQDSEEKTFNSTTPIQPTPTPTQVPPPATAIPTDTPQATPPAPIEATPSATLQPPTVVVPTDTPQAIQPLPTLEQPTDTPEAIQPLPTEQPPEPTQLPLIPPQAVIQGPSSGYVGEPVSFDASSSTSSSSPIASYSWNFGDGSTAGPASSPQVTTIFNQTGTYEVTVIVTDQSGQSSSAAMAVTIGAKVTTPILWTLSQMSGQPILAGTEITLETQGGKFSGFAGCNTYQGSYTTTQNSDGSFAISVSGLTGTGMACPEEIMQQEQTYLSMLSAVMAGQIQGSTLNLNSAQGELTYYQSATPK
jgi:heat shock protein HslJ